MYISHHSFLVALAVVVIAFVASSTLTFSPLLISAESTSTTATSNTNYSSSLLDDDECIAEGDILATNTALADAKPAFGCSTPSNSGSAANSVIGDDNTTSDATEPTCSIDYRTESKVFQQVCEQAKGQVWERSIRVECTNATNSSSSATTTTMASNNFDADGSTSTPTMTYYRKYYDYWNIPTCLGMSCDVTLAERDFDRVVPNQFAFRVGMMYLDSTDNITCHAQAMDASSSPPSSPNGVTINTTTNSQGSRHQTLGPVLLSGVALLLSFILLS